MFGLTNSEGNHGEDVKEIYYYLDATPTHSYLKMLYKYPQREFPYAWLVEESRRNNANCRRTSCGSQTRAVQDASRPPSTLGPTGVG